jgi:hypothetical protein
MPTLIGATYTDTNAAVATDEAAVRTDLLATLALLFNSHINTYEGQSYPDLLQNMQKLPKMSSGVKANLDALHVDNGALLASVIDFAQFKRIYAEPFTTSRGASDTSIYQSLNPLTNVYWQNGATIAEGVAPGYVNLTAGNLTDIGAGAAENIMRSEVNVYDFLYVNGTNARYSGFRILAEQLREIKIAYQLLDDDIFQNLVSVMDAKGNAKTLPDPGYYRIYDMATRQVTINGSTKRVARIFNDATQYTGADATRRTTLLNQSNSLLKFVRTLEPTTQDLFVLRRVLLGTYIVAHVWLFMSIFEQKKLQGTTAQKANANQAAQIAFYFYNKLQQMNIKYENSRINPAGSYNADNVNNTVMDVITRNVKQYKENTSRLATLSNEIDSKKRYLTNQLARIDAERASAAYAKKIKTIALTFSIMFAVGILVVMMLPFEFATRMKIAGGIAALVVIIALVLVTIVRRIDPYAEGFVDGKGFSATGPLLTNLTTLSDTDMVNYSKLVNLLILEELRTYYRYTIDIAMALKNNQLYNELNYNTSKERNYFENSTYQINKAVTDAKNAQRLYDRETKVSTSVIKVVLQLAVIVSFLLIGIMAVQDTMPAMRPVIYTIAGVLATVSFVFFFGEILGRTRMDADKMYWGQPTAVSRLA